MIHQLPTPHRHHLDPLLAPRSIALVGASPRPGVVGNDMIAVLRRGGFKGEVYLVNPRYETLDGEPCYPSLSALPVVPDLAVLSVASERMEALFDEAVRLRVGGVAIFDYCKIAGESSPTLVERLQHKARAAGMPICGGNCMGFYNFSTDTHISFQSPEPRKAGHIALIAHSGSVFVLPTANDPRYRFNLVVSAGQEIGTTVDEYIDYALEQPSTRVIAVFMEAVRNAAGFAAALEKASARGIPVVVTKVGRTEASATLAATHSGAIAGNDAAYEALFERYGVIRTRSLDDLMATALLLSETRSLGAGDLGYVSDSGGLRELMMDIADDLAVPFARISAETTERLRARLPHGLEPVNPLDAAGSFTPDYGQVFKDCLRILMQDPAVAIGLFEFEARDNFIYMPELLEAAKEVSSYTDKPLVVMNTFGAAMNSRIAEELLDAGVPMINGVETALTAIHHALRYRDARRRAPMAAPAQVDANTVARWRARLASGATLGEAEGLGLLGDFGLPATGSRLAADRDQALAAASALGYPVALKTAMPHIHHKSDVGGVHLGLADAAALGAAYDDLSDRLGPQVVVESMVEGGVELAFGMLNDPQFGPLVMVSAGGILIEVMADRCLAMAPFDVTEARRLIDRLRVRPLLDGVRGRPAADIDALAEALARFSELAATLADSLAEIDVNPVIAGPRGCVAVDALVVGREPAAEDLPLLEAVG